MIVTMALPAELRADAPSRRIYGRALPYGVEATLSTGQTVKWDPGSIDLSGTPTVLFHDETVPFGKVDRVKDNPDGQDVEVVVSAVARGDEALTLAADDVLTGLSVGAELTEFTEDDNGVITVTAATPRHLALVVSPAYTQARVSRVAASEPKGSPEMPDVATETVSAAPEAPAAPPPVVAPRLVVAERPPGIGDYLYAMLKAKERPEAWLAMQGRVGAMAAAPHTLSTDVAGLTYNPLVGALVDSFAPAARPVSEAFGVRAAPSGVKAFVRPSVQAHLDPAAAALEKTDVTDGPYIVDQATVTMTFIKRAANISAEALAFTTSDVLALVAGDLSRAYLIGFEQVVLTELAALATGTPIAITGGSDVVQKLYDGAQAIYAETYTLPDLLIVAPDAWAALGGYVGSDGRPIFPVLGPSNAAGTSGGIRAFDLNALGLQVIVSHTLAAGTGYLAGRQWFEVYESSRTDMRAEEPTILGVALGIGGAVGAWAANGKGIVPLTIA